MANPILPFQSTSPVELNNPEANPFQLPDYSSYLGLNTTTSSNQIPGIGGSPNFTIPTAAELGTQQAGYTTNALASYPGMGTIMSRMGGDISDLMPDIYQTGAERSAARGLTTSPNSAAAIARALGTTRYAVQEQALKDYNAATATVPQLNPLGLSQETLSAWQSLQGQLAQTGRLELQSQIQAQFDAIKQSYQLQLQKLDEVFQARKQQIENDASMSRLDKQIASAQLQQDKQIQSQQLMQQQDNQLKAQISNQQAQLQKYQTDVGAASKMNAMSSFGGGRQPSTTGMNDADLAAINDALGRIGLLPNYPQDQSQGQDFSEWSFDQFGNPTGFTPNDTSDYAEPVFNTWDEFNAYQDPGDVAAPVDYSFLNDYYDYGSYGDLWS